MEAGQAQGGPDAIVGLRDLLDKSKRQKEAAAEQEKEALLNGLAQLAAAQHLQESRIAAQEEQITALKAQIYKGVDFQVKAVEERINAKLSSNPGSFRSSKNRPPTPRGSSRWRR